MNQQTHAAESGKNPLLEKLRDRFSYRGQTVGEMMLARAKKNSFPIGIANRSDMRDITSESCITRANFLPRSCAAAVAYPSRAMCSPIHSQKINPCVLLAMLLCIGILAYLLVAGIRYNLPSGITPGLWEQEIEKTAILPGGVFPTV